MIVVLNGEIALGDAGQLQQIIKGANDSGKIFSRIQLSSLGENLLEGAKLADAIRFAKIASVVPNGATCASVFISDISPSTNKPHHARGHRDCNSYSECENGATLEPYPAFSKSEDRRHEIKQQR